MEFSHPVPTELQGIHNYLSNNNHDLLRAINLQTGIDQATSPYTYLLKISLDFFKGDYDSEVIRNLNLLILKRRYNTDINLWPIKNHYLLLIEEGKVLLRKYVDKKSYETRSYTRFVCSEDAEALVMLGALSDSSPFMLDPEQIIQHSQASNYLSFHLEIKSSQIFNRGIQEKL
jgi:hypothetical protein